MALEIKNYVHAAGRFHLHQGDLSSAWYWQRGLGGAAIVNNGLGDITVTLDQGIDAAESIVLLTMNLATAGIFTFARPADNTIRIYSWALTGAAVALDNVDGWIVVIRV